MTTMFLLFAISLSFALHVFSIFAIFSLSSKIRFQRKLLSRLYKLLACNYSFGRRSISFDINRKSEHLETVDD